MTKEIETIWQNGFVDDMALVAPKINDLYSMKSKNLIDKFEGMFNTNQKGVLIAAMVILAILTFIGAPLLGIIVALMLGSLVLVGKQQLKQLKTINKDASSFEYLQAFDSWLDSAIAQYTKIYRYFYPALFAVCAIRLVYADSIQGLLSEMQLVSDAGHPSIWVFAAIGFIALLLGLTGGAIYRADVSMVYGKEIAKLKELIAEMKVLRKN